MKLFLCLVLISTSTYSAHKARVKIVKGKVTKLEPGQNVATRVKKGDLLVEDTSIVTGDKSFVRIIFKDKSSMNIGSKSMVVINKLPAKKANMVNLLTGIIKAQVNKKTKKEKSKTKMLIKTRSAIMGVRGTKFQTTYNPGNKTTSLVTVEGKVAIVKIKEIPPKIEAVGDSESISNGAKVEPKIDEIDKLDKFLETSKDVVEVPAGRYSGVVQAVEKPTVPVKIAPKQFNAIAKSMGSKKKAKDVMKVTKSDVDPAPEGFSNSATGDFAPKAGGIIDFSTGIYVAPAAEAILDKKTGTFDTKDIGKIDQKTGDYVPPKGIRIDEKKGFVLDVKESDKIASNQDKDELKKTIAKLNKDVKKQIVVNKMESLPKKSTPSKWLPKDHILTAMLMPYSEIQSVKNKLSGSETDFFTDKANLMILTWKQVWNEKWSSRIRVGGQDYEIDDSDVKVYNFNDNGDNNDDGYFSIGLGYQYSKKINLTADLVDRSQFYIVPTMGDGVEVRSQSISSLDLGFDYRIRSWKKFTFSVGGTLHLMGSKEVPSAFGGEEEADLFGMSASGNSYYAWKKNMGVKSSLWLNRSTAEADSIEYTRSAIGLGFDFIWDV